MKKQRLSIYVQLLVSSIVIFACLWLQPAASVLADDNAPNAELDIAQIYRLVSPSVVSIEVGSVLFEVASGTGFVVDKNGHIVTNAHVVEDAIDIQVVFQDGSEASTELIGIDRRMDIAVIRVDVDTRRLKPVTFGDSDDLAVGESVLAIGNPHGLAGSLTRGIISGLNRELEFADGSIMAGLIQTDAAINPGNSGGPLINLAGEIVGVNSAGYRYANNLGFAIPSNRVKRISESMIAQEHFRITVTPQPTWRPWPTFTPLGSDQVAWTTDADGDGLPDSADNCPEEFGYADNAGCPYPDDPDRDGIRADADLCPHEFAPDTPNGCRDFDDDGLDTSQDDCPEAPGPPSNRGCPLAGTPMPTDTNTPVPTDTSVLTDTPMPTDTDTPVPTDTLLPTNTPAPTDTPTHRSVGFALDKNAISLDIIGLNSTDLSNVSINASILDSSGQLVSGLNVDDFSIGGDLAGLASVTRVENVAFDDLPFATVLVIDTSSSMADRPLRQAKQAAREFVYALRPGDPVAIVTFNTQVSLAMDYTVDRNLLLRAIDSLAYGGQTALYDATYLGIEIANRAPLPRRAVVILSDGGEYGDSSAYSRDESIKAATVNGVPVYTVGLGWSIDRRFLEVVSAETNAEFYDSPRPEQLRSIFQNLAYLFRTQYVITLNADVLADGTRYDFSLELTTPDGRFTSGWATLRAPIPIPLLFLPDDIFAEALRENTQIKVEILADQDIESIEITLDGEVVSTDETYIIEPAREAPGKHRLDITVSDVDGDVGRFTREFEVADLQPQVADD